MSLCNRIAYSVTFTLLILGTLQKSFNNVNRKGVTVVGPLFVNGRERWFRADNKTQARVLYSRLKADVREEKYFPDKFQKPKSFTLRVAIAKHLEGSTNRNLVAEKIYGRY